MDFLGVKGKRTRRFPLSQCFLFSSAKQFVVQASPSKIRSLFLPSGCERIRTAGTTKLAPEPSMVRAGLGWFRDLGFRVLGFRI